MRTPEQIKNVRKVMGMVFGPMIVKFLDDEQVEAYAENLQDRINSIGYPWQLKVKTVEDKEMTWDDIKPEPITPPYCLNGIKTMCQKLLDKYPKIHSIQIVDAVTFTDYHVFKRKV